MSEREEEMRGHTPHTHTHTTRQTHTHTDTHTTCHMHEHMHTHIPNTLGGKGVQGTEVEIVR